jgi:periplasmic protein CpxP/Spy
MNKTRILWSLLIVCLLSNVFLLWRSFAGHPLHGRHKQEPKHHIIEALQLDESQRKEYEKLIQEHRGKVDSLEQELVQVRTGMYALLADSAQANAQQILAVTHIQSQMEQVHYAHFKAIRALCKTDQLERFDKLTSEFPNLFSPRGRH